jgi:pSer/pThr/pTyr-binding forkhead associated (FHA) protein
MTGYYFVVEEGIAREKPIPVRAMVAIGRDPENDIQLSDRSVSKRHALVCLIGGEYVIQDLGSLNGIFINGERVKTAVLHSGDTLTGLSEITRDHSRFICAINMLRPLTS